MHFLGVDGMPRRIYAYPDGMGWELWNMVATIGAFMLGIGMLLFLVNLIKSARGGVKAPGDPWDGRTLEWTIASPPVLQNFDRTPQVQARDDFWDQKYNRTDQEEAPDEAPDEHIHLPPGSYVPLLGALGLMILGASVIFSLWIAPVGAILVIVGLFAWAFEPID
jgi:cytochrome c oxidase subunit 1